MLQFFNESAKQDCFSVLYNPQCLTSHFAYFQVFEDLHAIWGWILIEELHVPINQRNICAISILALNTVSIAPITFMIRTIIHMCREGTP